jgi:ureidoacrylate peracid hydrolase
LTRHNCSLSATAMKLSPKSAVVVIDVQNDFCSPQGVVRKYAEDLDWIEVGVGNSLRLVDLARSGGAPTFLVRSLMDNKYKLPSLLKKHTSLGIENQICKEGTWGAEFYRLTPKAEDLVVTKHTNDAFLYTFLEPLLWKYSIRTVVLAGVFTEICVTETARSALQRGFEVVVVEDCTAGLSHRCASVALSELKALQVKVISLDRMQPKAASGGGRAQPERHLFSDEDETTSKPAGTFAGWSGR